MSNLFNKVKKLVSSAASTISGSSTRTFVGKDIKGNSYFLEVDTGKEKRTVEYSKGYDTSALHLPQDLPLEWVSWLKYLREKPPTEKESKILADYREKLKANGEKWDEEQRRLFLQNQANEGNARNNIRSENENYRPSDTPPSFQFVADRLKEEGKLSNEAATLTEEFEGGDKSQNVRLSKMLSASGELKSTYSAKEMEQLRRGSKIAQYEEEQAKSEKDPFAHLIPDARYKRNRTDEDVQQLLNQAAEEFDLPKDMRNPSNLTQEQIRNVSKHYSKSRTSPFLGKKPQVRANSGFVNNEEEK
ncbi:hypothetical protein NAEGRDRAFT_80058 [Naegleria gruberi]|uniref:NADH dehydrogenase [ubiquinone] 1 alpha subcomplex subunit 12 n=1 Tax=Naegleria gruberi TaxID=5762 RepID=D2VI78_NAEGR|nr:uncharacterized protein NAEGRDRAFT_80058 [Naegleria gruberi]EFC43463.1 hypothetical protein NAEGRDRAFT_80058 [Naegleria gruberi]|eukprot:XP_002676207.1 hypothetical protein NAEGRDRAFT_80058 [Naegleria gruberi strain NEG-M]